jgi:hypothetical protein
MEMESLLKQDTTKLAMGSDVLHIFRLSHQTRRAALPVTLTHFEQSY